jgi:hypothetical protein
MLVLTSGSNSYGYKIEKVRICFGCAPGMAALSSGCKTHPATAPAGSNTITERARITPYVSLPAVSSLGGFERGPWRM